MPFITQEKRNLIDRWGVAPIEPGDRCYVFYKKMVDQWKKNPRWTTAHKLFMKMMQTGALGWDDETAYWLAWQVFFQLYVMPYELKKREENGDI